ncbi:unnamed protein product [Sphagnum jensenii]|uniref:Uncharacterized protein n=1 Tax=Sphagnum jensenii TaxID=128206 RepID=A0ABP0VWD2_9BRYO
MRFLEQVVMRFEAAGFLHAKDKSITNRTSVTFVWKMECENFAMEVDSGDSEAEKTHEKSNPAGSVSDTGEQIPQQRPWHPAAGIVTQ